jgi:hypothetical protein
VNVSVSLAWLAYSEIPLQDSLSGLVPDASVATFVAALCTPTSLSHNEKARRISEVSLCILLWLRIYQPHSTFISQSCTLCNKFKFLVVSQFEIL